MLLASWNVNGFRAVLRKGFEESFAGLNADILGLQETKMQPGQAEFNPEGYVQYWNSAQKKGYAGTAVFAKKEPMDVTFGIGLPQHEDEGRAITLEYPGFYYVTVYTPNSQDALRRLEYRMQWEDDLRAYLLALDAKKPVVYCGDLNVAHQEIDLTHPKPNRGKAGFADEEREKMTQLFQAGFVDSFRHLYPQRTEAYTWWSHWANARANNVGWRIDYFVVSERLKDKIKDSLIYPDVLGSDHCPVGLEIDL